MNDWQYTSGSIPTWRKGNVTIAQMRDPISCRDDALYVYYKGKRLFVCLTGFEKAVARLVKVSESCQRD